jgi:hypothetical protein
MHENERINPLKRTPKEDIRLRASPLAQLSPNVDLGERRLSLSSHHESSPSSDIMKKMQEIRNRQEKLREKQKHVMEQRLLQTPMTQKKSKPCSNSPSQSVCPSKSPLIQGRLYRQQEKISPLSSNSSCVSPLVKPKSGSPGSLSLSRNLGKSESVHARQQRIVAAELYEEALADQEVALLSSHISHVSPIEVFCRPVKPVGTILTKGDDKVM